MVVFHQRCTRYLYALSRESVAASIIEIDPARFDNQRAEHGMSRAEYVVYLMSLDKLPY